MQLTGPIFLFLFMPLAFLLSLPFSGRRRVTALSLVSLAWFCLANRQNPFGMALIGGLVLCGFLLLLPRRAPRLRSTLGIVLPLAALILCRISAEYHRFLPFAYPAGLTFVALGLISASVDVRREPSLRPKDPLAFFGYVLFFPVLTLGPVIRYRHFCRMPAARPGFAQFACGARLYALGYILRLAGAAMLLQTLDRVLAVQPAPIHITTLLILLLLCPAALMCLVCGVGYMARGVAAVFGLTLLRDTRLFPRDPARFLPGFSLSLSAFLHETVTEPLQKVWGRAGRAAGAAIACVSAVFFFRLRLETAALALPLLLLTLWPFLFQSGKGRAGLTNTSKSFENAFLFQSGKRRAGQALRTVLAIPAFAFFAAGVLLPRPTLVFSVFRAPLGNTYDAYRLSATLVDMRYLIPFFIVLLALALYLHHRSWIFRRLSPRSKTGLLYVETLLLFAAFAGVMLLIMPRFPALADAPFTGLYL